MGIETEAVVEDLPTGFDALRAEARAEGFRQVERLAADWAARTTRFDREGEALLAARVSRVLAGVGGLTIEPVVPGALRMRRFYVRPAFRRGGIGRQLVTALLTHVRAGQLITANVAPASISFWEAVGFTPDARDGHTHILNRGPEEPPEGGFAALVPEFVVGDLAASLHFWCDVLGFRVAYQRPEDDFAYLERGGAQVMLEVSEGTWQTRRLGAPARARRQLPDFCRQP